MKNKLTFKQQIKAINNATNDTRLTIGERNLYKWLSTQNRHKHLFMYHIAGYWGTFLKIDQKHRR